ncbi:hypothetical protein ACFV2Q_00530 [Streptomyces sp. NPDC059650]|uniref:hypothetical protein n=1 Tax=Streptomyces sp. NPDC059650 TaxID=3346896 RepID=UPI0036A9EBF2
MAGEHPFREGAGQGEFEEDGVEAVLVDGAAVAGLALAGAGEQLRRERGLAGGEEDAGGLLADDRQEVRQGAGQTLGQFVAGSQGRLGRGPGPAGDPLQFGDEGQGVVPVLRVVDQQPLREAELPAAAEADDGGFAVGPQAEEAGCAVLGGARFGGGEADHDPVVGQAGVAVGAGGELHGLGSGAAGAVREDRAGREEQFGLARAAGPVRRRAAGGAGAGVGGCWCGGCWWSCGPAPFGGVAEVRCGGPRVPRVTPRGCGTEGTLAAPTDNEGAVRAAPGAPHVPPLSGTVGSVGSAGGAARDQRPFAVE